MNPEFKKWLAKQTYYIVYGSFALKNWALKDWLDDMWPYGTEYGTESYLKKWTWDEVKEYYE
jgi:hypothetical protein